MGSNYWGGYIPPIPPASAPLVARLIEITGFPNRWAGARRGPWKLQLVLCYCVFDKIFFPNYKTCFLILLVELNP